MQDWQGQARSVFPVSTDNGYKLHFDWMIERKQYRFLLCQQIGMYDIWGYVAVCSSNIFVAMSRRSPDTHCEQGSSHSDAREGWPSTAMQYGATRGPDELRYNDMIIVLCIQL